MKDVVGRTIGIIDENGIVIACSELSKIGESKQRIREELAYASDAVIYEGYTYRYINATDKNDCICFVEGGDTHAGSMAELLAIFLGNMKSLYDEKYDKGSFIKNIILDNILPSDIYIKSKELHFNTEETRIVFLIKFFGKTDMMPFEMLQNMFPDKSKDYVISVGEHDVVLVKDVKPDTDIKVGVDTSRVHIFDKDTEKSIRRRIPEENVILASIAGGTLSFEAESFRLPAAVQCADSKNAEISMPVSALTLGEGNGHAKVQWIETIEGKTLYFLKVGSLTLFSLEQGEARFAVGDDVQFDIDFTQMAIESLGVTPLSFINTLDGIFTKVKDESRKFYHFYMNVGEAKLVPTDSICEKVFACKGNKIFHTPLEYIVEAKYLTVAPHTEGAENVLVGKVLEILDYGRAKYAVIDVYGQKLIAAYNGNVGETVDVTVPVEAVTIKDKSIDIIIV